MSKSVICYVVTGIIAILLIIVSMAGFAFFPILIEDQVQKSLDLTDQDSEGYKNFVKPPVPIYMSFVMYHVNNPEEIKDGKRPNVTEIGPFAYKEYREKVNISSTDGCSIQYAQYKRYNFDVDKTRELCPECGDARTTNITMINAAYVGMQQLLREGYGGSLDDMKMVDRISCAVDKGLIAEDLACFTTYPECEGGITQHCKMQNHTEFLDDLFIETTVDKFLFEGYESGVLRIMKHEMLDQWHVDELMGLIFPYVIQPSKTNASELAFAGLNTKNDTAHNEYYVIDTGKCKPGQNDSDWLINDDEDMLNYLQIKKWGPTDDRMDTYIRMDTNCGVGDEDCLAHPKPDPGELPIPPFRDFGWWEQNNGYPIYNYTDNPNGTVIGHNNLCNNPRGTDGQAFHPYVESNEKLWLFQTDICRSLYLEYQRDHEFMGFDTLKFILPAKALKMETELNLGFCKDIQRLDKKETDPLPSINWDNCTSIVDENTYPEDSILNITECKKEEGYDIAHDCRDGIMDITRCMAGAPVVLSSPHFYQSDDALWQMIDGMSDPNEEPEKYETFMYIEPYTGAALKFTKRLQFNIPLNEDPSAAFMGNLNQPHSLFPMFWLEEFAELDSDYKNTLDDMLTKPLRIIDAVQWTMFAVGVMMLIVIAVVLLVSWCRQD